MELIGVAYPFSLGVRGKNKLQKQGGYCKRWVNINHADWSNPVWQKVVCKASLVDRSLGPKKYAYLETEIAVMTEYEDPVLNMITYDLVPCKSVAFDLSAPPPLDINLVYEWATLDNIAIWNEPPLPIRPHEIAYPLLGMGGVLVLINYLRSLRTLNKENL